jgi:hypothetical protein
MLNRSSKRLVFLSGVLLLSACGVPTTDQALGEYSLTASCCTGTLTLSEDGTFVERIRDGDDDYQTSGTWKLVEGGILQRNNCLDVRVQGVLGTGICNHGISWIFLRRVIVIEVDPDGVAYNGVAYDP